MTWDDSKDIWERDGSLRDIYIFDTTLEDWQKLLDHLGTMSTISFAFKSQRSPRNAAELFRNGREGDCLLSIDLRGLTLHSHLLEVGEIELDVDPREIREEADLERLLGLLCEIGRSLGKDVRITPEGARGIPIWQYFAAEDRGRLV